MLRTFFELESVWKQTFKRFVTTDPFSMNFFQKTVSILRGDSAPLVQHRHFHSDALGREVVFDVYLPGTCDADSAKKYPLLLFNDGQDLPRMSFVNILETMTLEEEVPPFIVVGVYTCERRIREYGTARQADYKGRGDLAPHYTRCVLSELLPHLRENYPVSPEKKHTAFAGFSLGGLSALDIVWAHPEFFGAAGVFSGALWWRSHDVLPEDPDADRIMHDIIQLSLKIDKDQRFWFQCGTLDEKDDRNHNGIIDAIDDTLDLIRDLGAKGIPEKNIRYLEVEHGRHEPATWGEAMPDFLKWWLV